MKTIRQFLKWVKNIFLPKAKEVINEVEKVVDEAEKIDDQVKE